MHPLPGKVSELMLDFARPLLDVMSQPRHINDLRSAFELVVVCWDLPIFERGRHAEAVAHRRHFDSVIDSFPKPLSSALLGLFESRTTTFGRVPFMVIVEI